MTSRFALLFVVCGAGAWACTNDYSSYDFAGTGGNTATSGGGASGAGGSVGGQAGAVASGGSAGSTATGGGGAPTGGGGAPTGGGGGTGLPSCGDEYGSQSGVLGPCPSSATECELQFAPKTATCNVICAAGGGECVGVYDNIGSCGHGLSANCNSQAFFQAVCVCSHGCGGGAPCVAPATCQSGSCQ
jgi:hypothetical protein